MYTLATSLVLFQDYVMSNFYWLLAEGLHLHALLVAMLPSHRFTAYLLIGWGVPTICTRAWAATRLSLEDTGCWDTDDHSIPWWVIRTPILISIIVSQLCPSCIIQILLQRLTSPDVGGNNQSQYKRLTKSTLLLIPLFGVHYVVFAVFPIGISSTYQILLELCIRLFQGLVVAVLYCFLNSEVQGELRRKWRGLCRRQPSSRDHRLRGSSVLLRNGSESALPCSHGSRAPSFLQQAEAGSPRGEPPAQGKCMRVFPEEHITPEPLSPRTHVSGTTAGEATSGGGGLLCCRHTRWLPSCVSSVCECHTQ
ncbi:LOW QUALITY PROTEIN: vasoactive intestinal polypeptide receptor 2 [Manis pentadactyla]|uniref:LOW QUALITY PROTEIN: vasoactive intestinal polypeptide receptor 2 n=1 Tax=Manis pentadactyla TaxID=143292 RepID=UPI00255CD0F0|nr:LOW QUALITY PROTEIN: vasoactive intestinal polypeptide receptor 2 [Manis pentadactyla]